jgi:3(or 17)beta-hydroxysteroid dehydrogenase
MGRLEGKVALVTGGGSGLGEADCLLLAREGAQVVVTDANEASAKRVAESLSGSGLAITLDVTSQLDWREAAQRVEAAFGRLDVLVNNAGICLTGDVESESLEQFRRIHAVMNEGVFLGCKYAMPLLKNSNAASIINVSSVAALRGYSGYLSYSTAKGAVTALTKSLAAMCQDKGYKIRCNSVHPGDIETPMQQAFEGRTGQARVIPPGVLARGEIGAPSDVASLVVFLASDESRFITGAEFVVDNGATARAGW